MHKAWVKICNTFRIALEKTNGFLLFTGLILIVFIFIEAVNALGVYISLINERPLSGFSLFIIDILWKPFVGSSFGQAQQIMQKEYLAMNINVLIAISGVLLTLITVISYLLRVSNIKRHGIIQRIEVFEDGKDDIKQMEKYYKNSDKITVFSGNFSWLQENRSIRELLEKFSDSESGQLLLCSQKNCEPVKKALEGKNIIKCFKHVNVDIRCSLIKRGGQKYFLYKHEDAESQKKYVIVVKSQKEGNQLLEAIEVLINSLVKCD